MEHLFNVEQLLWILLYQTDSEGLDQLFWNAKSKDPDQHLPDLDPTPNHLKICKCFWKIFF